jgi:aryl-alcohol dehydrogenase-like predicted oxidoreductase
MTSRTLGTTGIRVPQVFLGCGTFGGIGGARHLVGCGLARDAAFATLDEALALGIDVLDTAERYANGESERTIGAWLRHRPQEVTRGVRIATKVAPPMVDGVDGTPFDRVYIERKLQTSLERLGVERVTFYLSHGPDKATPIEETVEGFAAVVESGRAAHVGCCNAGAAELIEALDTADRLGVPGFEWVQNSFSLLSPIDDREVRAVCRERGLGYTPFSPLAGGVLTGKYQRGEPFPEGTRMALRPEAHAELMTDAVHDALDQLRDAATVRAVSCGALALAWMMAHPACTAPIVGPSRAAPHLGHVAEALKLELTADEHALFATWFEAAGA